MSQGQPTIEKIDIDKEPDWLQEPKVSFDQKATLQIAQWVLIVFGGVYLLSFVMALLMFRMNDAKFDGMIELTKFLLTTIIPLVTLAVGYYLGDKSASAAD